MLWIRVKAILTYPFLLFDSHYHYFLVQIIMFNPNYITKNIQSSLAKL